MQKVYHQEQHEEPANYNFEYSVHDEHTGDIKSQKETAHDGHIEGHYSLVEPDGHRRIVHYTADDHSGFEAKVEREEIKGYHAPEQQKYVHSAPINTYSSGLSGGLTSGYHHH